MSKLFDAIQALFKKSNNSLPESPFAHHAIDLKAYPVSELLNWHALNGWQYFNDLITKANNDRIITGVNKSHVVTFLSTDYSNGWHINCAAIEKTMIDFEHLAYYVQSQVSKLGYKVNLAEKRSRKKAHQIETFTKYYLKPSLKVRFANSESSRANQLYGNITIEFKSVNDQPSSFKFLVTAYQDALYELPLPFEDLMSFLLD